jgi:hypothetical protein
MDFTFLKTQYKISKIADILDYQGALIYVIQENCSPTKDTINRILDFGRRFSGYTPFNTFKFDTMCHNFTALLGLA